MASGVIIANVGCVGIGDGITVGITSTVEVSVGGTDVSVEGGVAVDVQETKMMARSVIIL